MQKHFGTDPVLNGDIIVMTLFYSTILICIIINNVYETFNRPTSANLKEHSFDSNILKTQNALYYWTKYY